MDHFAGQLVEVFEELLATIQEPIGPLMLDDEHRRHKQETCNIFLWFLFIILIVPSLNILAPWKKNLDVCTTVSMLSQMQLPEVSSGANFAWPLCLTMHSLYHSI